MQSKVLTAWRMNFIVPYGHLPGGPGQRTGRVEHLESLLEIFSLPSIIVLLLLLVKSLPPLELHP